MTYSFISSKSQHHFYEYPPIIFILVESGSTKHEVLSKCFICLCGPPLRRNSPSVDRAGGLSCSLIRGRHWRNPQSVHRNQLSQCLGSSLGLDCEGFALPGEVEVLHMK